jgi:hypothetical protein
LVNGDVFSHQTDRAVSRFKPLSATRAAVRSASLSDRSNNFALRERAKLSRIAPDVDAGALDIDQRASLAVADYSAYSSAGCRYACCVDPPSTAKSDGDAATVFMSHGRRPTYG